MDVSLELIKVAKLLIAFPQYHSQSKDNVIFWSTRKWPKYFVEIGNNDNYTIYDINSKKMIEKLLNNLSIKDGLGLGDRLGMAFDKSIIPLFEKDPNEYKNYKYRLNSLIQRKVVRDVGKISNFLNDPQLKSLVFKDVKKFNSKKKLFDFLVAKEKMDYGSFGNLFGTVELTEDEDDRTLLIKDGKWNIYYDKKSKKSIDEVKEMLNKATNAISKKGLSKLAYGNVFIVNTLSGGKLADYMESSDNIRVAVNKLKRVTKDAIGSLIHELGHRNWFKFFNNKADVKYRFEEAHLDGMGSKVDLEVGDLVGEKSTGNTYEIVGNLGLSFYIKLIDAKSKVDKKKIGEKYRVDVKKMQFLEPIGKKKKKENWQSYFPTAYSMKNVEEFYAELFKGWVTGELKDPAKSWFGTIH